MRLPREYAPVRSAIQSRDPGLLLQGLIDDLVATAGEVADLLEAHHKDIAAGGGLVLARLAQAFRRLDTAREEVARRVGCMTLAPRAVIEEGRGKK